VTLFTPWTKQVNIRPDVSIIGVDVPLKQTFDFMFTFHQHIDNICAKAFQCLKILKAVCGSSWGHDEETLLTYKALVESVFSYAAAVWFPNAKPSNTAKLQFMQNSAMHLITSCHRASAITHFHAEMQLLPVVEHLSMLCARFLTSCLCRSHPSHEVV
jgi:hypothetical protein